MGGAVSEIWQRQWICTLKQLKVDVPDHDFLVCHLLSTLMVCMLKSSVNPSCEFQLADMKTYNG